MAVGWVEQGDRLPASVAQKERAACDPGERVVLRAADGSQAAPSQFNDMVAYFASACSPGPRLTIVIGSNGNSRSNCWSEPVLTAMRVAMSISSERYCLL